MRAVLRARQFTTFLDSINSAKNHKHRVLSTPTWPVPYYTRIFRDPPKSGMRLIEMICQFAWRRTRRSAATFT